ncbi:hypothetical protein BCR42DRAFT_244238 [Absidia repens]|uniref:Uncharacterized protein n=1 Tax=Absidia repens TaxID=90262 RepID=A0A1X2ILZ5_9FUNG|nr:hypothetical protein BCR42DRAFT_244238 [Absidia repens]
MTDLKTIYSEVYKGEEYLYSELFMEPDTDESIEDHSDIETDQNMDFTENDVIPPQVLIPNPINSPFIDAISPSTMVFLATLKANNHKSFTRLYQSKRKAAKWDFKSFVGILGQELHHDIDDTLPLKYIRKAIQPDHSKYHASRNIVMYPTSLKARFGRVLVRNGSQPSYKITITPGNETKVSVGVSYIVPDKMQELQPAIIMQGHRLRELLSTECVRQIFGEDKTWVDLLDKSSKVTVPNSIPRDVPNYELLSFNRLLVTKKFDDIEVVSPGFLDKVLDVFCALAPFHGLLCDWLD